MKNPREEIRKITINLPASLIDPLLADYPKGQTELIREALTQLKRKRACERLRSLRGKVKFSLTYDQIKEDRE
jgi:hypothetical protein